MVDGYHMNSLYRVSQKKTGICGKLSLRAIGLSLSKKLAHFWRIHEILHLIDTKIVQFDPLGAEKIESKDGNPT